MDNILKGIVISIISLVIVMASCAGKQGNNVGDVVEITPSFTEAVHKYDELYPFSEGLAAVKKDGKYGYINTKGELVIPCKFDYASDFIDSTAVVVWGNEDDDKPFCILKHDGQIIETKYKFNHFTYYNSAPYSRLDNERIRDYIGFYSFEEMDDNGDATIHYLDKNLNEVPQPSESLRRNFTTDSLYVEYQETSKNIYGDDITLWGLKTKDGNIIIPAKYTSLKLGDNGIVVASIYVEDADSHYYSARYSDGLEVFGYIDLKGNSTFTDADLQRIVNYKQEQLEELDRIVAEEEQARLDSIEEAKRKQQQEEDESKGPEWIQGSWELTINSPYGAIATYHLTINGQNAHLVEGNKDRYNGLFEIIDDHMIVGPRKYYINESYQRLEYAQYRWHKISGGSNHQAYQGRNSSFSSASDVMRYLSGRTFYNSGDGLRIDYDAVYFNGTAMTGAPRVVDISGNSATVVANSPYSGGGTLRFYVNSSNGTVTQNGDVYRER